MSQVERVLKVQTQTKRKWDIPLHGPNAGQAHVTQWYDDGYRLSRDIASDGTEGNVHWTNQNVGKKHKDRNIPPSGILPADNDE